MAIKNYMEEAVACELEYVLKCAGKACACKRCREDIVAWSLNRLPAKYVVTDMGHVYTKMEQFRIQEKTDITTTLMKAVKVVAGRPRH